MCGGVQKEVQQFLYIVKKGEKRKWDGDEIYRIYITVFHIRFCFIGHGPLFYQNGPRCKGLKNDPFEKS